MSLGSADLFSPALYPHNPWVRTPDGEGVAETEELKKYLHNALSSLTNVRSVRCVFYELLLNTLL